MKIQILISVILGLHNSIFTVNAKQACQAVEKVWSRIGIQWTQRSGNRHYADVEGELQSKGNWHFS